MNYTLCHTFPNPLLLRSNEVCLSIYMPTHKLIFDHKKDILVFKNLAKEAKLSLELTYSDKEIKPLISLLKKMEDDFELWNDSKEGLAIFATLDEMIIYRVFEAFKPLIVVSNSFHFKPLIQYYQSIETYTLLALEAESFKLYEGNYLEMKEMKLIDEVDTTLGEVLGTNHTESYQTHGVYGGASDGSTFHGHGGRSDEVEIDREKFFRHVDRFVLENISKKVKHPLILVTHKEHHFDFKSVSTNPYMLDQSIDGSYEDFSDHDLKMEIKKMNDERFDIIIHQAMEKYHNLRDKDLSSDQLILVLKGLLESRVDTLFIEEDKIISGKIDIKTQQIIQSDLDDPKTDDLLDDMIEHAFKTGTKIFILPKDKMPSTSGVAAIFRY